MVALCSHKGRSIGVRMRSTVTQPVVNAALDLCTPAKSRARDTNIEILSDQQVKDVLERGSPDPKARTAQR